MTDKLVTELSRVLRERGWSQRELARRANVSHTSIAKVLNGEKRPTSEFCQAIAPAIGVSIDEIYQWAGLLPEGPEESPPEFEDWGRRLARLSEEKRRVALETMEGVLRVAEGGVEYHIRRGKADSG